MGMLAVGMPREEEPRPNPLIIGPETRMGKGDEGTSGPARVGRSEVGIGGSLDFGGADMVGDICGALRKR
jgi:hypothetical protein